MQTCAGNTGARSAGTVTTGTVAGNGAATPVAFVGGTTSTRTLQWGAISIANAFTICSVTRYSGATKRKIQLYGQSCWRFELVTRTLG